MTGMI